MAHDVEYVRSPLGTLMFLPKGVARPPGIVLLHGSNGGHSGWTYMEALDLAAAGFAAMPFGYSKGGDVWFAGDIHDVELHDTAAAIRALRDDERVSGKIGLYGVSRGAEHALLLVSLMARDADAKADLPEAVAVHAPSDFIVGAFIADNFHPKINAPEDPTKHAWLWRGSAEALAPGTPIPIERYDGPLTISHGEEDELWPVERSKRLEARLKAAGRAPGIHYYPRQGHSLGGPAANLARDRLKDFFRRTLG